MYKVLIFFLCFYILLRLFARFILPWIIKRYFKKLQNNIFNQNQHYHRNNQSTDNIEYSDSSDNDGKYDNIGEYIDFEEEKK